MENKYLVLMGDDDDFRKIALRAHLAMEYVGKTCQYCGILFDTVESLDSVVVDFGQDAHGGKNIAHKDCFREAHPELPTRD